MQILKSAPIDHPLVGSTLYLEKEKLRVSRLADSIHFVDLTHALKTGKTCPRLTTRFDHPNDANEAWELLHLNDRMGENVREYLAAIANQAATGLTNSSLFNRRDNPSNQVFSPFNLSNLSRVDAFPAKWTLAHVKRTLANGQYSEVKCTGKYTDDYAFDAAVDCQRGNVAGLKMLKELVESPSGWWTSLEDIDGDTAVASVCCHHFNCNKIYLDLSASL